MYEELAKELTGLLENEVNFVSNASNFTALLKYKMPDINWIGFYMPDRDGDLLLGPFQGSPACVRLAEGKGVCGASFMRMSTIIVADVHAFEGHIACDPANNSEIVVPVIEEGEIYGVLDIDSVSFGRFTEEDKAGLENLISILVNASDMELIREYYINHEDE